MPWEAIGVVLGVVLGLANLGLYWFTWRRENRRQERLATMQERLTAIEEARRNEELASRESASVSARFKQEPNSSGSGTNHWLVLSNGGLAVARNSSVEVVAALTPGALPRLHQESGTLPVDLPPGEEFRLRALVVDQTASVVEILVSWEDATGSHVERRTVNVE